MKIEHEPMTTFWHCYEDSFLLQLSFSGPMKKKKDDDDDQQATHSYKTIHTRNNKQ